ncbi:hypothetical protein ALP75_202589 [Pseudomonas syringae pv. actinidiae]|nr:hypothetical protein ALP75_202589 [Pseudomonas syringae pv. actinidiae]
MVGAVVHGENHHFQTGHALLKNARSSQPVEHRHADIENRDVRLQRLAQVDRLLAVGSLANHLEFRMARQ